jgi:heme/copper-type cytochrome/quinol oxidase subunit 1
VNWEAISAIGQIVGAIAVVISLIYLATEIRSNARATREASMRSLSDAVTRWLHQLAENPHLAEVFHRGIQDYESLEGFNALTK